MTKETQTIPEKKCALCGVSRHETHFMVGNNGNIFVCLFCICTAIELLVEDSKDAEDQINMALRLASGKRHRNQISKKMTEFMLGQNSPAS